VLNDADCGCRAAIVSKRRQLRIAFHNAWIVAWGDQAAEVDLRELRGIRLILLPPFCTHRVPSRKL
jgi:hypothetical protein